ncbi:MAG TPA: phosphate ABC transporter substrate-binding protein PstS [Candidatus Acidoferrales bacterium]|nr:phosphate ABC transporter substrate-binding protein PstS [Candidatus Acidoferrales bacterium]
MFKKAIWLLLVLGLAASAKAQSNTLINAAGATFPYPIYSLWFDEYHKLHPNIQINYASIGSGGGIQQMKSRTVDFGASDMPLNDQLLSTFDFKIIQFPTVLGAVVPSYNIPSVNQELKFTPKALADIYLGKVTKWNDPEIAGPNPGVRLPANDIVVVHRSDGSGTTFVWTDYLSKVSPEWKSRVGSSTSVRWPVGLGGKGNEGVAGLVQQTPNAIGYVELIYALQNKMGYGVVQNAAGKFVKASLATVTSAAAGASVKMRQDVRVSITDAPGADSYPICSFTYLLIPEQITDPVKRTAIRDFLRWMLTAGQSKVEALNYAPLPKPVVAIEEQLIAMVR